MNISVTADGSLLSPTGRVNTIHPEPEIHEHKYIYIYIYMTKGYGTLCTTTSILTFIERIVNNCVNDATHADELTMQH